MDVLHSPHIDVRRGGNNNNCLWGRAGQRGFSGVFLTVTNYKTFVLPDSFWAASSCWVFFLAVIQDGAVGPLCKIWLRSLGLISRSAPRQRLQPGVLCVI